MSYNNENSGNESGATGGNIWSAGSRGGSRGGYSRSDDDENRPRGRGSYRGSSQNFYPRRSGGGYGFRRSNDDQNDDEIEVLKDAIFIQNLPRNITRDDIQDAFSTVGPIKANERSGGPKIWIYKDRMTGEGNGRATVTYEDEETAQKAISEYNDQHIDSLNTVVRVQLAQRRTRNNDRGGFNNNRGYRGGYNNDNFHQNSQSDGHYSRGGRGDGRGFRGRGRGGGGDRGRGFSRGGSSYGANRGGSGSPSY